MRDSKTARRLEAAVRSVVEETPAPTTDALLREDLLPVAHGWLLLCLLRQLSRQRWMMRMVKERITGRGLDEDEGDVPGYAGWKYCFHGIGCYFEGPGELIDMDFLDEEGATIDAYFFAQRILSLTEPALPESRLLALLPGASLMVDAIDDLRAGGLFGRPELANAFRLPPELEALAEVAESLDLSSDEATTRCLAHLRDFEALATRPAGEVFQVKAEAMRRSRRDWLLAHAGTPGSAEEALAALQGLSTDEEQVRACVRIIEGPVSSATGDAVKRLDALPGAAGSEAVLRLALQRLSPSEHHPYSMHAAAKYLLARDIERERVLAAMLAFARVNPVKGYGGNPFIGDFALLALEYAHEHARELVRLALRSSVPASRQRVAAVLFVIDRPWCHHELAAALQESDREPGALMLAVALSRSQSDLARAMASRWHRAHPLPPSEGPGFTWAEVEDANASGWFDVEVEKAREWVARAAPRLPETLP
ncbi:hypothetical protein JY651_51320 [Pyxidicoccus parkwayensis]|uniref:DUF6896 domain-containing protein n=1 Tax=Pyxidicoccus parkwayensis TaxID=2813578 RepID=A0ABX7NX52_9BACT|nr:hypothetical protein [Pyxidicoccus parkwaysis]QSQ23375.1 hypothetical protein JY651_51320 [Pyxidicoccus parkwaysis]